MDVLFYPKILNKVRYNKYMPINSYQIQCLSIFVKSLVLFDKVIVYSYRPEIDIFYELLKNNIFINSINEKIKNCITIYNPHSNFSLDEIFNYHIKPFIKRKDGVYN